MGNTSSKKESDNVFTNEELRFLETAYRNASGGALEKLTSDRLVVGERYWVVALVLFWLTNQCSVAAWHCQWLRSQVQGLLQQCHATP